MNFMDRVDQTLTNSSQNISITENGAVGYRTTGQKLLDMNFAVSSMRKYSDSEIESKFKGALGENFNAAVVWLFFARDVRGGMGERRLFRVCMSYLAREFPHKTANILPLMAEYGRWDDLVVMIDTPLHMQAMEIITKQLIEDMENLKAGKSISLIAKWLPSENASSSETRRKALKIISAMKMTPKKYRKMLSVLRRKIDLVEQKMTEGKWAKIDYKSVPSRANMVYNKAFLRHDETRRREFLSKANKGEVKMNAATLYPYEIAMKYRHGWGVHAYDESLEAMWKNLPNTVKADSDSTIVVADGSGSMYSGIAGKAGTAQPIDVANSLAIYFAERLSGPYKNRYITFSESPQMVDLRGCSSLREKLGTAMKHDEVANTNIEAVFDLLLETAVRNRLAQNEIPSNVLIISDMEFDRCATSGIRRTHSYGFERIPLPVTLFDTITAKWESKGYKLPRLVFWNVASRTGTIPVRQNELGVALVSGFSPNVAKMVMSNKTNPYDALMETLQSERYMPVWKALEA